MSKKNERALSQGDEAGRDYWLTLYRHQSAAPGAPVTTSDYSLDDYWLALYRRKWLILLVVVAALAGSWYFSKQLTPQYEASTVFYVPQDLGMEGVQPRLPTGAQAHAKAYAQILKQPDTWRIINERHPGKPLNRYGMDVDLVVPREGAIQIYVRDEDPQLATDIANGFAAYFNEFQSDIVEQDLAYSLDRIDGELENAELEVAEALEAQRRFLEQHNIASLLVQQQEFERERVGIDQRHQNEKIRLAQLDREIEEIRSQLASETAAYAAGEINLTDPIVQTLEQQLVQLEVQMAGARMKYKDEHPEMLRLREEYDKAREKLTEATSRLVASRTKDSGSLHDNLRQRLTMALVERSGAEAALAGLSTSTGLIDGKIAEVPSLLAREKQLEYAVQRFSSQRRTLEATRDDLVAKALQQKQVALVIDTASAPTRPVFPVMWLNLLVASLGGLVAGALYALLLEHIESHKRMRAIRVVQVQSWARSLTENLPAPPSVPMHSHPAPEHAGGGS